MGLLLSRDKLHKRNNIHCSTEYLVGNGIPPRMAAMPIDSQICRWSVRLIRPLHQSYFITLYHQVLFTLPINVSQKKVHLYFLV